MPIATRLPPLEPLPATLSAELRSIYSELEAEVRALGVVCWARGDCCDFERCDHRLYASTVEVAYVAEKRGRGFSEGSALCPFWADGKCTERERRPLGCRTYFCDRRYKVPLEALHEKHYSRIRKAAEAHGYPVDYGPFVPQLRLGEAPAKESVQ